MKKILSFWTLFILLTSAVSQVPNTFHFQGALKDSDGVPVNDIKYIEFRIYDAETAGSLLWNEGPMAIEIINGLFSMELGGINPFPEGFFDISPLYLTFALASGEMEPRQKLLSVPYALKAASSDEDWLITGNYIVNLNDSIGIGTANPQTRFEVNAMMRLTPTGLSDSCDLTLEGSIYYDINLKEYCFCDGANWKQLDGGGYCECVDLDNDGADICNPDHPYDTDGLIADCDDANDAIYPGSPEFCDGIDNDCDPATIDGFGDPSFGLACDGYDNDLCEEGTIVCLAGTLACSDFTGDNEEICDGLDNDCDPSTPDGSTDPLLGTPCDGPDADECEEGVYVCNAGTFTCTDNTSSNIELCDGLDNDCDGQLMPEEEDWDADGYCECTIYPGGWQGDPAVIGGDDCDNYDDTVYPGANEICDGIDNDCDGLFDEDVIGPLNPNQYGVCAGSRMVCDGNGGWIPDYTSIPQYEVDEISCDGLDNDCDAQYDEGLYLILYADQDEDGYGDPDNTIFECPGYPGYTDVSGDCDDTDPNINPDSPEMCTNGIDDNCNGLIDCETGIEDPDCLCGLGCPDNDSDGYPDINCGGTDCNDNDITIYPGAPEVPDDGIDQDCDGYDATYCYIDSDFDGYGNDGAQMIIASDGICDVAQGESLTADDCDDDDPNINPGAVDDPGNDLDENCSGTVVCYNDNDDDGYGYTTSAESTHNATGGIAITPGACSSSSSDSYDDTNDDCNDSNSAINPGVAEICDDGLDNDCDLLTDINDPDCLTADSDYDGLINILDPDPFDPDLDNDGLCDGPLSVGGVCIGGEDLNADGSVGPGETNPLDADSDDDGLSDGDEDINGNGTVDGGETDPGDADTDNDGLTDGLELGMSAGISAGISSSGIPYAGTSGFYGDQDGGATTTNPINADTDNDGLCDGPASVGGICISGEDLDADGLVDGLETNPADNDTDDDGSIDGEDCYPLDYSIYPEATEIWYDGIDQNCDGWNDFDQDMDGYVDEAYPGEAGGTSPNTGDCNDTDPNINPGAGEICGNTIDDDCDGLVDDNDPDCN